MYFFWADSLQVVLSQFPVRLHVCGLSQTHTFRAEIGFLYSSILAKKKKNQGRPEEEKHRRAESRGVLFWCYLVPFHLNVIVCE